MECLVFGAQLQDLTSKPLAASVKTSIASNELETPPNLDASVRWLNQHRKAIGQLVWQSAGISREANQMNIALEKLAQWQTEFDSMPMTQAMSGLKEQATHRLPAQLTLEILRLWTETRNLLTVAKLVLKSAVFRTESRGGHYRSDYPETDTSLASFIHLYSEWGVFVLSTPVL